MKRRPARSRRTRRRPAMEILTPALRTTTARATIAAQVTRAMPAPASTTTINKVTTSKAPTVTAISGEAMEVHIKSVLVCRNNNYTKTFTVLTFLIASSVRSHERNPILRIFFH